MQPKPYAMQLCNIATGAACNYTNAAATFPISEISRSGVRVSQHLAIEPVARVETNIGIP